MKRFFALVFSLLLCTLGSGCAGEKGGKPSAVSSEGAKPLRVLIDIAYTDSEAANSLKQYPVEKSYRSFEEALEEKGGIADVAVETLPGVGKDMTEREARLTNLRTEIMAGAGPDVYICPTQNDYQVFPYPRQAIEQELFLALDDYLPKAQFTDMGAFLPVLAEAGQYEGKQYLLPLAFTLPVTLFRESEVQHELSDAMTWEDMLQGGRSPAGCCVHFLRQAVPCQFLPAGLCAAAAGSRRQADLFRGRAAGVYQERRIALSGAGAGPGSAGLWRDHLEPHFDV